MMRSTDDGVFFFRGVSGRLGEEPEYVPMETFEDEQPVEDWIPEEAEETPVVPMEAWAPVEAPVVLVHDSQSPEDVQVPQPKPVRCFQPSHRVH